MGVFSSVFRYIVTLGGLIGGDVDARTDDMIATPSGIKTTYNKTRDNWKHQYTEVREAVAQLMTVLEQRKNSLEKTLADSKNVKIKMKGAVEQYKSTEDKTYQTAFNDLFARDQALDTEQESLGKEIDELHGKVEVYRERLTEMKGRIQDLDKQEAAAIADIVSSKQIISLNDRLNNLSTDLDDRNLSAIEERRAKLAASAKLSDQLASTENPNLEKELLQAGMQTEAADLFAAMMSDDSKPDADKSVSDAGAREL